MLEQGPGEEKILRDCIRYKMPIPDAIQNAPELQMGLELFMQAFIDLDGSRVSGMQEGRIPWLTIWDYCDRLEILGELREDMLYLVQELDIFYLNRDKKD